MDLNKLTLFQMAKARMDHSAQRQKVLAQNVANADTPKYRPSDLKPLDFKQMVRRQAAQPQQIRATMSDPRHSQGTIPNRGPYRANELRKTYDSAIDGNSVVLEEQMIKVSQAKGQYTVAMNLFRKNMKMIRIALGKAQ